MNLKHWVLLMAGFVIGLMVSGRLAIHAQERAESPPTNPLPAARVEFGAVSKETAKGDVSPERPPGPRPAKDSGVTIPVQEALLRPYRFPFAQPTSLGQVCAHLRETLKAAVVLDLAALDRKSVEPESMVQLDLDGVRLKTGLKLLLDQVGLTYHVVAEDNLMIITDQQGSEDPAERIWSELRALHRDLHAVQDAVDDLSEYLGLQGMEGARVRKPTIIEEMPENAGEKPGSGSEKPGHAVEKPSRPGAQVPGSRSMPSRVPLAGPRRSL